MDMDILRSRDSEEKQRGQTYKFDIFLFNWTELIGSPIKGVVKRKNTSLSAMHLQNPIAT